MRIVGGALRGRRLAEPRIPKSGTSPIRPTTDRVRESLFNILTNRISFDGINVIDLFAGTGALGIEALSRGAAFCLFVETSAEGRSLISQNLSHLSLDYVAKLLRKDARNLGARADFPRFDLVFADPPYSKGYGEAAVSSLVKHDWLADDALVVLEEATTSPPSSIEGLEIVDQRPFGNTTVTFFQPG